jgi:hypothetical protein
MTTDQASILLFLTLAVAFVSGCAIGSNWQSTRKTKRKSRHAHAR